MAEIKKCVDMFGFGIKVGILCEIAIQFYQLT